MAKRQSRAAPAPVPELPTNNLSLDLGNAYSKIQGDNGLALDYRSIMAPLSQSNKLGDWPVQDVIQFEGAWWVIGDRAYTLAPGAIQEHPTVGRYTSPWYRRLFAFALHKAFYKQVGNGVLYPRIISSVPAELFKSQDETDAIKANVCGDYQIGNVYGGELHVTVFPRQVVLIPEGIGTYFGFVFGPGNNSRFLTGTWMIADAGYLTFDTVAVRDQEYMPDQAHSDEHCGISVVAESLRSAVFTKTHVRLDRAAIDRALECNDIDVSGRMVPIGETKAAQLQNLGQRAALLLEQWAAGMNLSGILLCGGGAPYLHEHIQSATLPPIILAANPRRSNVEGGYAYITSGA